MSELFRKTDEDFGGSISWNTQHVVYLMSKHPQQVALFFGDAHSSST